MPQPLATPATRKGLRTSPAMRSAPIAIGTRVGIDADGELVIGTIIRARHLDTDIRTDRAGDPIDFDRPFTVLEDDSGEPTCVRMPWACIISVVLQPEAA